MHRSTLRRILGLALGAALCGRGALLAQEKAVHPKVEAGQECETCHEGTTPAVHAGWKAGAHGQNGVKCLVCHGAIGETFTKTPAVSVCAPCHFDQAESMQSEFMKAKTCFTCHTPHGLKTHGDAAKGGQG